MYLYENKIVFFCMVAEVIMTVGFIIIQKLGYFNLVKESENMKRTKDVEVISISKNRKNVYDVDNFVDKYVNKYKFGGLKLYTISRICGYLVNILFITWSAVTVYGLYCECGIKEILWIIMLGIIIVGGLFSFLCGVDNSKLEQVAKVNIKEYIGNILEANKNREEIIKSRKERTQNSINNIHEKTVIDYNTNNENVVAMNIKDDSVLKVNKEIKEIDKKDMRVLDKELNNLDNEELILEGFLRQYFA